MTGPAEQPDTSKARELRLAAERMVYFVELAKRSDIANAIARALQEQYDECARETASLRAENEQLRGEIDCQRNEKDIVISELQWQVANLERELKAMAEALRRYQKALSPWLTEYANVNEKQHLEMLASSEEVRTILAAYDAAHPVAPERSEEKA